MRPEPVSPCIDDPMALLSACHDQVRRFCALLLKLSTHVEARGVDEQARTAATAVLRYFELAAPLHHEDEDVDFYPALLALGDAALDAHILRLSAEHDDLNASWRPVSRWLKGLPSAPSGPQSPPPELAVFCRLCTAHATEEERELYPHAARLSEQQLARLAQAMTLRRTLPTL